MIMMQGENRLFDKVIIEGGTAAARTISLYGVKACGISSPRLPVASINIFRCAINAS